MSVPLAIKRMLWRCFSQSIERVTSILRDDVLRIEHTRKSSTYNFQCDDVCQKTNVIVEVDRQMDHECRMSAIIYAIFNRSFCRNQVENIYLINNVNK